MKRPTLLVLFLLALAGAQAQTDPPAFRLAQYNVTAKKPALDGYDPVSYFSGTPRRGSAANSLVYQGITYQFASAQNKEAFQKDPVRYEPQYGGWCAYAMGKDGSKVDVDPETFKIVDNKLYLFYNRFFTNTLKLWNKDEARLMKSADASWKKYRS